MRTLGKIQVVDARTVWGTEANDFTPWLAEPENIELLGREVGLALKVQAQEKRVGPFRADILCEDSVSKTLVLIENQLGHSDHGHLGQLFTYAAGLDTATIIWLALNFCEEHKRAVKWLNEITDAKLSVFAVRLELLRISGSPPAPRFTIVAGPKERKRLVTKSSRRIEGERIESAMRRLEYWKTFLAGLRLDDPDIGRPKANSLGNLRFNLEGRDLWITVYAASSLGRIGVFLRGHPDYYPKLLRKRRAILAQLKEPPWWECKDGTWSVGVSCNADPKNIANWAQQQEWLAARLNRFIGAFKPFVGTRR